MQSKIDLKADNATIDQEIENYISVPIVPKNADCRKRIKYINRIGFVDSYYETDVITGDAASGKMIVGG